MKQLFGPHDRRVQTYCRDFVKECNYYASDAMKDPSKSFKKKY